MADTIEIVILAKDQVSKTVGGIRSSLSGLGNAFAPIRAVGTAAFLGIGAAAVGGFGLAMGAAINMNSTLETSTLQFETLMGDADRASEHVKGLFDFAASTPFETGPIIEASRLMQVFGGDALNTRENLTRIGNPAAAVGKPIEDIGFWVGRAYAAIQGGQPFGEAAQNLMQLGAVSPDVIARMNELKDSGASADEIFGVLQEHMGTFSGAMEKQAGTWSGMMSTLNDSLQMAAAEGLKPFFELAKSGLSWLNNSGIVPRVGEIFSNFFKLIATAPDEGGPLLDYLQELPTWLQPIGRFLAEAAVALSDFFSGIRSGEDPIGDFANLGYALAGALGATQEQAAKVFEIIRGLGDKIVEIGGPVLAWIQNNVQLKDVLAALGVVLASVIVPAIIGIISAVASVALPFIALVGVITLLRTAWENNWGGIQEKTAAVVGFLKTLISGALAAIQSFWAAHGEQIMAAARQAWETIQRVVSAVVDGIRTAVSAFLENVRAFWEAHGEAIVDTARKAWELIQGLIEGVVKHIKLIVDAFRLAFQGDWEGFGRKIFEIWKNAWDTVVNFLRGLWDLIVPILVDFWDSIRMWFSQIDWGSLGRNIVQGIINGVKAMGGALTGALKGIVDAAIAAIKAALGIASPSRVFYEIGVNMIDGLIQAIRDKQPEAAKELDDMFSALTTISNLGGSFGNLFAAQNIAPIEGLIEDVTGQVEGYTTAVQDMMNSLGLGAFKPDDPGVLVALQNILNDPSSSFLEQNAANTAIALLEERQQLMLQQIELQRQLEEQQNRLLRLEMQRQQLGFLQEQFELLKLIRDNGLDVGLLDGLTFGADADPGALMDAMIGAMTAMIGQTTNELMSIAPPPRSRSLPAEFFQDAAGGKAGGGGSVVVNIDARGAANGVEQDVRRVVHEVMREYGVRADIRMRTT